MRKGYLVYLCAAVLMMLPVGAVAQGMFTLDHVDGLSASGTMLENGEAIFWIRITNNLPNNIAGITNGFRIYSPDGATWTTTSGDTTGSVGGTQFDAVFAIGGFGIDGMGSDTISFGGAKMYSDGLVAGFDDIAYSITIGPITPSQDGGTICMDSSFYRPIGIWKWAWNEGFSFPNWDGPHCYAVEGGGDPTYHTLHVPSEYATIQSAIDAAGDGDTVMVAAGTYVESLDFLGKEIVLLSEDGAETTTLQAFMFSATYVLPDDFDTTGSKDGAYYRTLAAADPIGAVITLTDGSYSSTVISGFTIDGMGAVRGIYGMGASPEVSHCIIENCVGPYDAGGVFFEHSAPVIKHNTFRNNETPISGAAVFVRLGVGFGTVVITDNVMHDNTSGNGPAVSLIQGDDAVVERNIAYNNVATPGSQRRGAIYFHGDNIRVTNNTSVRNTVGLTALLSTDCDVRNNIIASNLDGGFEKLDPNTNLTWDYNDVWGNGVGDYLHASAGAHDISANPQFDPVHPNGFYLLAASPCVNTGDPDPMYNDPDGSRNDIGARPHDGDVPPPGNVLHVPSQYATIQAAIDAAADGDSVLVAPGTYEETINYLGKLIVVTSSDGPLVTTITIPEFLDLVTFENGEGVDAVLVGFTLLEGRIGVRCRNSGPTIQGNILKDQNIGNWGAISLGGEDYATPGPCPAVIVNNTIVGCANGGISTFSTVPPVIMNNVIAFNGHYGIHREGNPAIAQPILSFNDIFGNRVAYQEIDDPGEGTIEEDPLFAPDLSLTHGSPCINAGNSDAMYNDPDGSRNDMGALPFDGGGVVPTDRWIDIFCSNPSLGDAPLSQGDLVQAFDPDGILCGQATINEFGALPFTPVYADDPFSDRDEGAEPGDHIMLTINGEAVFVDPPLVWTANGDGFETCDFIAGRCQKFDLDAGWHLISWNVAFLGPAEGLAAQLGDCLDVILGYNQGALTYDPNWPDLSTLREMDYSHGYWIRLNSATSFNICGPPIAETEIIPIGADWNLVGYWPQTTMQVGEGMQSILEHLVVAYGFEDGIKMYVPNDDIHNNLNNLNQGLGYWVKSETNTRLVYPGWSPLAAPVGGQVLAARTGGIAPTRVWMSVFGKAITLDGEQLPERSQLEIVTDKDVVCGSGIYESGSLKFTPVYGLDGDSEDQRSRYPVEGDRLYIRVNGVTVDTELVFAGHGTRVQLKELSGGQAGLPQTFSLSQNYPNPFNPTTTIQYSIPVASEVGISVYNVLGQHVQTLAEGRMAPGTYEVTWDGTDERGNEVSSGVYLFRLQANDFSESKKMMLVR